MNSPLTPRRSLLSRYFAFLERRSILERLFFHIVLATMIMSALWTLITISNQYLVNTPMRGGVLVEGVVGTPRFVNPVLAVTRADQDMVALVYDGLMRVDASGNLVPDIAESVTVSEDGTIYTIKLRSDVYFHNGNPLTAKDVAFTIGLIQNPELKSPLHGNWDGVVVEEVSDTELTLTLREAYAPFIENLTVGILPRGVWDSLPIEQLPFSQYNTEPVGTGSFAISKVMRDESGLIDGYVLTAAPFSVHTPNIKEVVVHFYGDEAAVVTALKAGEIDGTPSLSPDSLNKLDLSAYDINELVLPRVFGVYFNQNKSTALLDPAVREALDIMIDRDELVQKTVAGHGIPTTSPIPPTFLTVQSSSTVSTTSESEFVNERAQRAGAVLTAAGWKRNDAGIWEKETNDGTVSLSLTLSTSNTPLFDTMATTIAEWWKALGVDITVNQYEQTDLVQAVIRPRNYQVLLFGSDVGRSLDLYPFWHSSQKDDPGLNITQYTNIESDRYLTTIRTTQSETERNTAIAAFTTVLAKEKPALFLFAPTFTYLLSPDVTHPDFTRLSNPSERFATIYEWYATSERLWPIFSK